MAQNTLQRYLWFFDTVWRYKRITRAEIDRLWQQSDLSNGEKMTRRTFYNYREGAEMLFDVNILCDPATYEYYIEQSPQESNDELRQWMFDMLSVNYLMRHGDTVSHRILPEQFPSGNDHFAAIIGAMQEGRVVRMIYHPFWKMSADDVEIEPYFVKAFRKRWYLVGYNRNDRKIKTYALDRVQSATLLTEEFEYPDDFVPTAYFANAFGVMRGDEIVEDIRLKVSMRQAQYFRALPLHESQQEYEIGDGYVMFGYRMSITYDLVQELMSLGREVEVIAPRRLRDEVKEKLQAAFEQYL